MSTQSKPVNAGGCRKRGRRQALALTLAVLCTLIATPVWAGSYLDRASLLVSAAVHDADYLRARIGDRELARIVHRLAEARLKAADTMAVP
jgi:hypothetical protein